MYSNIIRENLSVSSVKWWPMYAYHFTDITNAVSILTTGRLYSRLNANSLHLMKNDNASRQVIDMTSSEIASFVRFYFRPLTPTQYHNEGFKHSRIRYDNDENANVPVPVFLVFDLNKLLCDPKTMFSGAGQAGYGTKLLRTVDEFKSLDFCKIYGGGIPSKEDIPYRHAEIVYPDYYDIDNALVGIACRNETERQSLCNLLWERNHRTFYKYKSKMSAMKYDMFQNNGLFVSDCDYSNGTLGIRFSNTKNKADYARFAAMRDDSIDIYKLQVSLKVSFDWVSRDEILSHKEVTREIDYADTDGIAFSNIPAINGAKELHVKVFIEDKLMGYMKYQLAKGDVL